MRFRRALPLLLALGVVAAPTLPLWSSAWTITGRDIHRIFRPAAYSLQRALEQGTLPEWEPTIACGQPLAGLGQSQLAYPPRWIQLWVGPDRTLSLLAVFHPLLAALCAYGLARSLGRSRTAGAASALVVGASPLVLATVVTPNLEYAAAWVPLLLWLTLRLARSRDPRDAPAIGVVIGLQALAGAIEIAVGSGLLVAAVLVAAVLRRCKTRSVSVGRVAGWLGRVAVIAALVSAPELLPVAAHARTSARAAALPLAEASMWSAGPRDLAAVALPISPRPADGSLDDYKRAQGLLDAVYLGLVPIAVALLGFSARGRRRWLLIAGGVVLLSLGTWGGLFPLLHLIPGLDRLRFPVKFLLLLPAVVAVGVAYGMDSLRRLTVRVPARALALFLIAADLGAAAARRPVVPLAPQAEITALTNALPRPEVRFRLGDALTDEDWWHFTVTPDSVPPELDAFVPNFPQTGGVRLSGGYGPNLSARVLELTKRGGRGVFALMGESQVLTRLEKVKPSRALQLRPMGEAALVDGMEAQPRGLFFSRWEVLEAAALRDRMLAADYDPMESLFLETAPGVESKQVARAHAVTLVPATSDQVLLRTREEVPGVLLLQDTWDPGWSATVDGQDVPVLRAGYAFMGVGLTPGEHVVLFTFRSWPLRIGLLLAALGLALSVGAQMRRAKPR